VIAAFGAPIEYAAAKFEDESAIPSRICLHELPAIGPVELLRGADADGVVNPRFAVWASGHERYHDYLLRGICRAAKLAPPE
jgi:hypothetical protein